jgi:hypothetical protein
MNSGSVSGIIINGRIASWSTYRVFSNRCEYDIVGRALDDIALMEAETGSQGILDAILRNACWSDDRKRLHTLLRKVEEKRHDSKRRNSKKDEDAGGEPLPQWSGDWQKARGQLVTEDLKWIERARAHGLPVEFETKQWARVPRDQRTCECGAKKGDCEHAIEHCPIFEKDRRKTRIRLRELGLRCDSIWALVKKAGGPMKDAIDPIEQKRKVLMEISAYIGRIAL